MALIIKREKWLFSSPKQNRLLITKDIFKKIIKDKPLLVTDLNIDTIFKVAWAGFMRIVKLTYTMAEEKKATFTETGLIRSDISF